MTGCSLAPYTPTHLLMMEANYVRIVRTEMETFDINL